MEIILVIALACAMYALVIGGLAGSLWAAMRVGDWLAKRKGLDRWDLSVAGVAMGVLSLCGVSAFLFAACLVRALIL